MARLPDAAGMKNEVVMVRSQRNQYDHAIRSAGVHIVEAGLPDRVAGAGVRDAEPWEIAAAVTERTAAIVYVANASARPMIEEVARVANSKHVPLLVDAAAQLPPAALNNGVHPVPPNVYTASTIITARPNTVKSFDSLTEG